MDIWYLQQSVLLPFSHNINNLKKVDKIFSFPHSQKSLLEFCGYTAGFYNPDVKVQEKWTLSSATHTNVIQQRK